MVAGIGRLVEGGGVRTTIPTGGRTSSVSVVAQARRHAQLFGDNDVLAHRRRHRCAISRTVTRSHSRSVLEPLASRGLSSSDTWSANELPRLLLRRPDRSDGPMDQTRRENTATTSCYDPPKRPRRACRGCSGRVKLETRRKHYHHPQLKVHQRVHLTLGETRLGSPRLTYSWWSVRTCRRFGVRGLGDYF